MKNSYDYIAEQWHSNFRGQTYIDRVLGYVDKILESLPFGAKVLDLGCGTGNPIAKHIVERGFRVVGVDQSKELLKIAKTVVAKPFKFGGATCPVMGAVFKTVCETSESKLRWVRLPHASAKNQWAVGSWQKAVGCLMLTSLRQPPTANRLPPTL